MPKVLSKSAWAALLLVLLFFTPAQAVDFVTAQKLVVLDPGHESAHPGMVSPSGATEHQITLALAQKIAKRLSTDHRVQLTPGDAGPARSRAAFANNRNADLFISLHLHTGRPDTGRIFYYDWPEQGERSTWQTRALAYQEGSKAFGQALSSQLQKTFTDKEIRILGGPALPLQGLGMPALLIEPFSLLELPPAPDQQQLFLDQYADWIAQTIDLFIIP